MLLIILIVSNHVQQAFVLTDAKTICPEVTKAFFIDIFIFVTKWPASNFVTKLPSSIFVAKLPPSFRDEVARLHFRDEIALLIFVTKLACEENCP